MTEGFLKVTELGDLNAECSSAVFQNALLF